MILIAGDTDPIVVDHFCETSHPSILEALHLCFPFQHDITQGVKEKKLTKQF